MASPRLMCRTSLESVIFHYSQSPLLLPKLPALADRSTRSLSHIAPPHAFSTDDSESAQIPVIAMDLGEKIGHEQAQNLPPLES